MTTRFWLLVDGAHTGERSEDLAGVKRAAQAFISKGAHCEIEAFASPVSAWGYLWDPEKAGWRETGFPSPGKK